MPYKQILGSQGKSYFIHYDENDNVLNTVTIENTSPSISYKTINGIEQNWNGDNVDLSDGLSISISFEIYNVLSDDYANILKLFRMINSIRKYKTQKLRMIPYYTEGSVNWGLYVLASESLDLDNVKKYINTAQKIVLSFVNKYKIMDLPQSASKPIDEKEITISIGITNVKYN